MIKYTTNEIILQIKFVIIFEVPIFGHGWYYQIPHRMTLTPAMSLLVTSRLKFVFSRHLYIFIYTLRSCATNQAQINIYTPCQLEVLC